MSRFTRQIRSLQWLAPFGSWLLIVSGCSPPHNQTRIPFEVQYAGRAIACDTADTALSDLRFFVHDVELHGALQEPVADGFWQSTTVALLDFEDGSAACINGTDATNHVLTVSGPAGGVKGLEFSIGVPPASNHANPVQAEPPLSFTDMHWHWRSGYKFLRGGLSTMDDGFWLHLGSNRCSGTIGDIQGCEGANRPRVSLPGFVAGHHKVVVDLAILFADVDLENGEPGNCSSGPGEASCRQPFSRLGLNLDSGASSMPATAFSSVEISRP